ncbi:GntR family transcriptional regulator [Aliiglaciecola sp. CAU 1673]|uniref:GntR family transcriptional regulator n=1 Tax=Aliiglaciecola sp. CAU 1673 TaxID=3032595 RepID=UPI0023DB8C5A|nr:GntR family transcriptional regulator [Aliiglaciecola sp. CAU 1673]MDF2178399.1 GntR family transcriptional regulator [Aliiglaciecola sp. CAU 1673]
MSLYHRLKEDLQQGQFIPGQVLTQKMLAERYAISRIPVRDAVKRLQSEGWLTLHGKCGIKVPEFNAKEVEDIYLMRMHLEPLLLEFALPYLNRQRLGEAKDLLEALDSATDAAQIGQLNQQFHSCLYQAAGRPALFSTVEALSRQAQRYIGYQSRYLQHQRQSQQEHYQLLTYLENQETEKALALLKSHIAQAGLALVAHLQEKS